ncbi:MAG: Ni/Fe hydrogenase subunit alpha [Thermoprotei archaeon]|nr:MAG: Ni/Fe hydrogenase subunit alpha [Thermoprotei archaeon]
MKHEIIIDPITRLEGHGKIVIFLDDEGNAVKAYFQIPELRGFEKFLEGRPAEDAPQITSRICGVCPTAHHTAATKALDDLYKVDPPSVAKKIRELVYNAFMLEDHALHVYILGGPDFIVGPKAPKSERNIYGVIKKVGLEVGLKVIKTRRELRNLITAIAGKVIHPVFGLPGGISKPLTEDVRKKAIEVAQKSLDFALFTYKIFKDIVLSNQEYLDLILSDAYTHRTYYMGLVDDKNRLNFYDGKIRIVDPKGNEYAKFDVHEYHQYIAEHVEPWTYVKFLYLKKVGWKGFVDGENSGILCVAPLARLNVADSMATPRAQEAFEEMFEMMGSKPVHHTLAMHWARIIEMIYAAERMIELANDPELTDPNVRVIPTETPGIGMGVVEAPRGLLIHHYETDEKGIIKKANLLVATQHNAARIALSVDKAAKNLIKRGNIDEGLLNMIEMAFRAYDPCHACATHSISGSMSLAIYLYNLKGKLIKVIKRDK